MRCLHFQSFWVLFLDFNGFEWSPFFKLVDSLLQWFKLWEQWWLNFSNSLFWLESSSSCSLLLETSYFMIQMRLTRCSMDLLFSLGQVLEFLITMTLLIQVIQLLDTFTLLYTWLWWRSFYLTLSLPSWLTFTLKIEWLEKHFTSKKQFFYTTEWEFLQQTLGEFQVLYL